MKRHKFEKQYTMLRRLVKCIASHFDRIIPINSSLQTQILFSLRCRNDRRHPTLSKITTREEIFHMHKLLSISNNAKVSTAS